MSFFFTKQQAGKFTNKALLHQMECKLCPLYNIPTNKNKDIKPQGTEHPLVYILGMGPGKEEDAQAKFFVGESGRYLRSCFTEEQIEQIRFNNITRTRDPNDDPPIEAIECCRPSVERDILATKPKAIFGMGALPLKWAFDKYEDVAITDWRGKHFPIDIAGHVCWFFPMFHPAHMTRNEYLKPVFDLDLANAYKFLDRDITPIVEYPKNTLEGVEVVYDVNKICDFLLDLIAENTVNGLDLETRGLRPYEPNAKILTWAIGNSKRVIAFPWKHRQAKWTSAQFAKLIQIIIKFIESGVLIGAHNLSFELEWICCEMAKFIGWDRARKLIRRNWQDTMASAYVLGYGGGGKKQQAGGVGRTREDTMRGLLSLDNQCLVYFGLPLKDQSSVDRANLEGEELDDVLWYNGPDAKYTARLWEKHAADLKQEGLERIYKEHLRRIPTLVLTQIKGLPVSVPRAKEFEDKFKTQIDTFSNAILNDSDAVKYRSKGADFNPASPQDMTFFFKSLGFDILKEVKDSGGKKKMKASVDEEVLKRIEHPVAKNLLEFRRISKLKSTYCLESKSTKVLMANLTWKLLQNVQVGDQVLTLTQDRPENINSSTRSKKSRLWKIATVTHTQTLLKPCLKISTPDGQLVGSFDHFALVDTRSKPYMYISGSANFNKLSQISSTWESFDYIYKNYKQLILGLRFFARPWEREQTYESGWLEGFLDGEGYISTYTTRIASKYSQENNKINGLAVGFSQNVGPVLDRAIFGFHIRGFDFDMCKVPFSDCLRCQIRGGVAEELRFLGVFGPTRLVSNLIDAFTRSRELGKEWELSSQKTTKLSEVLNVEVLLEDRTVKDITTTEGTFIANGFLVHNCDIFLPGEQCVLYPDGKIHSFFTSLFTTTGRLSSKDPNVQNFPSQPNTKDIRSLIVAPPGYVFASNDYGQIEFRVMAMVSHDKKLIDAIKSGYDVHADWARKIAKAYPKIVGGDLGVLDNPKIFKAWRNRVKNDFVFAGFYGASTKSLAEYLGVPLNIMMELHEEFWSPDYFAIMRQWQHAQQEFYKEHGYIEMVTGRRRYAYMHGGEIINTPIQGVASDIVLDGMNRLSEYAVETKQMQFQSCLNVHDDLSFLLPEETWEKDIKVIIRMMLSCKYDFLNVPLSVESAVGPDWYNIKPYGTFSSANLEALQ